MSENSLTSKTVLSTTVYCRGHKCTMAFDMEKRRIFISRPNSKKKTKTYLNLPLRSILNIETEEERKQRQLFHLTGDDSSRGIYAENTLNQNMFICGVSTDMEHPSDGATIYPHSRVNTQTSSSPGWNSSVNSRSISSSQQNPRVAFFIHYIRVRGDQKPTIHTFEFRSGDGMDLLYEVKQLVAEVLKQVYTCGYKKIVIFISPKSGKGKGEEIVKKYILPILQFSRHTYELRITTRSHDCEDYIANLSNVLDSSNVVACAGGDGMIHEAVNGLHRRKVSLLKALREEANGRSPASETNRLWYYFQQGSSVAEVWEKIIPMVATIATGSACGLAKSLNVLQHTEAALSLIHLRSCCMDLMRMKFIPNPDLLGFHGNRLQEGKHQKEAEESFLQYLAQYKDELAEREEERKRDLEEDKICTVTPFLKDGTMEFKNPVSHYYGFPDFQERVAFMSLSFGIANDIDHGSEHLRWMGNNRFTVYGGYLILRGLRKYPTTLRYLPWQSKSGLTVEKIHSNRKMPDPSQLPLCTMTDDCPHCKQYPPEDCVKRMKYHHHDENPSDSETTCTKQKSPDTNGPTDSFIELTDVPNSNDGLDAETFQNLSNEELLNEEEIDFEDETLPWVTIRGEFFNLIICNLRDVAQDMIMAPLCHLSDGAIDIVYAREDLISGKNGRKEMVQFMTALEKGSQVEYEFCHYVKARALEVKVDRGISMSDGELMPLSSVRMTKMRQGTRLVRYDPM